MSARQGTRLGSGTLHFSFDGRRYAAQEGDSAASALLANGVRALGRSVKARRLRGMLAAGPEEPCALLTAGTAPAVVPNLPAPQLVLHEGLVLRSQNRWPSLHWDAASLLQAGGGLFGAGFYYKTFFWPSWRRWEPLIRRLAGLGEAPGQSRLPPAAVEHAECDVLVAGAGPAGLAAACAAARAGARVVLCEREPRCGGELEFESATIEGQPALAWVDATLGELARRGARVLTHAALVAASGDELILRHAPRSPFGAETLLRVRARAFIAATGAVERPIAFAGNDLPGVMLQGAADRLLGRYGVTPGRQALLFGSHDRMVATAARLAAAGVRVAAIVDTRGEAQASADPGVCTLRAALAQQGTLCLYGHAVVAAEGGRALRAAQAAPLGGGAPRRLACDSLLMSGGWTPLAPAGLPGGDGRRFAPEIAAFVPGRLGEGRSSAGAAAGDFELAAVLAGGHAAGNAAARGAGATRPAGSAPSGHGDAPPRAQPFWRSPVARTREKRVMVDWQNDVTLADLRLALEEGFVDVEHAKRYTALGMGTEQGATSALLGAALLAELKGGTLEDTGLARPRPPLQPVPLGTVAGLRIGGDYRPARRTPLHAWHEAHGGVMDAMGLWMRPRWYRGNGPDAAQAAVAEARRVRAAGGIADASTLGKIEVAGADAGAFLDTLYLTKASRIPPGAARYMVNLREDGMVLDDGIVLRLAADRFLATTSSGHGGHMLSHFEHHRALHWAGRAVALAELTDAWAVIAVAGPRSRAALQDALGGPWREVLARLEYMRWAGGHPGDGQRPDGDLRVLRAGYSGELAYEVHCRPRRAVALWEALVQQGLAPYGIDALDILRLEKGYLGGGEINGQTTPQDLGMERLLALGNDCLGRELLDRPAFSEASRPKLVGLQAADAAAALRAGAQLTTTRDGTRPCGYLTSAAFSPALGRWVALALLAREHAALGATLWARDPLRGADTNVRVVPPVHFDPQGERSK
jgi:sarcosine oxidase subunit alpha